jgi:ribonuclease HI
MATGWRGGYAAKWRQQGWTRNKGKDPAVNPDLWDELLNLAARHEVTFEWVKGHQENVENTRCDELAVLARQGQNLPADEGYEKPALPRVDTQLALF